MLDDVRQVAPNRTKVQKRHAPMYSMTNDSILATNLPEINYTNGCKNEVTNSISKL